MHEQPLLPSASRSRAWKGRAAGLVAAAFAGVCTLSTLLRPRASAEALPVTLPGRQAAAQVWQTARDTGELHSKLLDLPFVVDFPAEVTVDVTAATQEQEILGFGGAFTEASAVVFKSLNKKLQERVLDLYFGEEGLGYTIGRVHINSCDFSVSSYSFDDVPEDFQLEHFDSTVERDTEALIPLIQAALAKSRDSGRQLRLFASPWSPPAWMKTSGRMDSSDAPGLRDDCQDVWARYIVKWIDAYNAQGIHFWGLTAQNEPMWNASGYEACLFTAQQEASFVGGHLGPAMAQRHPEVLLIAYDHNKPALPHWAKVVYGSASAAPFVAGIAFHWYGGDRFDAVQQVSRAFPDGMLLATEATYEWIRWADLNAGVVDMVNGAWSFGEGYAHDMLGDLNAGAAGWVDWNLLLDMRGGPNHAGNMCDAALVGDNESQQLHVHPQLHYIGHISRHVPPGSRRLDVDISGSQKYSGPPRAYGTCTADDGLAAAAFRRPDGGTALVVLNCGDVALDFKVLDGKLALAATIPAHGIQTYRF